MRKLMVFILGTGFLISVHGYAQDLDPASQKALQQTQDLLRDQAARQKAIKGDSKAQSADSYVNNLTGGNQQTSNDVYGLAADVFSNVVKDAHGDPKKMQEAIDAYSRNPAAFLQKMTPEQRQKLEQISNQLPATTGKQN